MHWKYWLHCTSRLSLVLGRKRSVRRDSPNPASSRRARNLQPKRDSDADESVVTDYRDNARLTGNMGWNKTMRTDFVTIRGALPSDRSTARLPSRARLREGPAPARDVLPPRSIMARNRDTLHDMDHEDIELHARRVVVIQANFVAVAVGMPSKMCAAFGRREIAAGPRDPAPGSLLGCGLGGSGPPERR